MVHCRQTINECAACTSATCVDKKTPTHGPVKIFMKYGSGTSRYGWRRIDDMPTPERAEKFIRVAKNRQRGLTLVLEDIHDPHNAAAIMRTCDAFGIQDVRLVFETEKAWNPRRVGKIASSSANKWLTFRTCRSSRDCIRELKRAKYEIVATALTPDAENVYSVKLTSSKLAILVGNEHRGLSPAALKLADHTVKIPMRGMVQSLNVSVSTALAIAEVVRQRDRSASRRTGRYRPSPREAAALAREFLLR